MRILVESDPESTPGRLDEAWDHPATFALLPAKTPVSEEWVRTGLEQLPASLRVNHFALLSSGSTGRPTLVVGSCHRAEELVRVLHHHQRSDPVKETPLLLPLSYCYAFVNQWLWARVHDRRLVAAGGFHYPGVVERTLSNAEDAMLCLVGAQVPLLIRSFKSTTFPAVIRLHFAGGPFPGQHLDAIRTLFPTAVIFNNYGCVEAMPRLTVRPVEDALDPTDIGQPLPGIEFETAAEGALKFRSPYGAVAFWDDAGLRVIDDNEFIPTGDRGFQAEDGSWRLQGRNNEVFKRFGEKIALPALLDSVNAVWRGSAAFYRETDDFGEPAHVLVLAPTPKDEEIAALLQAFGKSHPRTHWPLRIESLRTLPLTANGKVDVAALARSTGGTVEWRQKPLPKRRPST